MRDPLSVVVHYDFASTLCYVAHRVADRMAGFLAEIEVMLIWTPIDLAPIMGWTRGTRVAANRRQQIRQIADSLGAPARVPTIWLDSRDVAATALLLRDEPTREASWRERVYSGIYEEGVRCDDPDQLRRMHRELGIEIDAARREDALARLEQNTRDAVALSVAGVPTFMLGRWPMGGIQEEETMRSLLGRWAQRQRARSPGPES